MASDPSLKTHLIQLLRAIDTSKPELNDVCKMLERNDIMIANDVEGKRQVFEFISLVFSKPKRRTEANRKRVLKFLETEHIPWQEENAMYFNPPLKKRKIRK